MLEIGQIAPNFELLDQNLQTTTLSQFLGKVVVLYFYPKDDTPGCTIEACAIRDTYKDFEKAGIMVLGVSYDDPKSHTEFAKKFNLPFTLLSDPSQETIKAYDAYAFPYNKRITYIIGSEGKIVKIYPNVEPAGHAKEILDDAKNLSLI